MAGSRVGMSLWTTDMLPRHGPPARNVQPSAPAVSVVVATYNGERFVGDQLASLMIQSLPPDEVIIADDGSTDGTVEIAREHLDGASKRTKILERTVRLGYSDNFLSAAAEATGELIAFCDQDDVWDRRKLERVVSEFEDPEVVLVAHHAEVIDEMGAKLGRIFPADRLAGRFQHDLPLGVYPGFSLTARASLLEQVPFWERATYGEGGGRVSHDVWLWLLAPCFGTTIILRDRLVDYRQHAASIVGERHRTLAQRATTFSGPTLQAAAQYHLWIAHYFYRREVIWRQEGRLSAAMGASKVARRREEYADYLGKRGALYDEPRRTAACRRWVGLVLRGTYRRNGSGAVTGLLAAGKDLLTVMAIARRGGRDSGVGRRRLAAAAEGPARPPESVPRATDERGGGHPGGPGGPQVPSGYGEVDR